MNKHLKKVEQIRLKYCRAKTVKTKLKHLREYEKSVAKWMDDLFQEKKT